MTFLFDIGKVLLDFDFETSLRRLLPAEERDPDTRLLRVLGNKDAFERGDLSLEDYLAHAEQELGPGADRDAFINAWRSIFTPNDRMWQIVEDLAGNGHRLLYFSNINPIHAPWIFETYSIFRHFEGGTCSHLAGLIKPEPEIYHHAIREHGLIPDQTLYIDDLAANIAAGRELGFRCHQYRLDRHDLFEAWLQAEMP